MKYPSPGRQQLSKVNILYADILNQPHMLQELTKWTYDTRDPYVLSVEVGSSTAQAKTRVLGRALFAAGIEKPVGLGDVRLWPLGHARWRKEEMVAVAFSSSEGAFGLELSKRWMESFLQQTYGVVPEGQESDYAQPALDAALHRILLEGREGTA